MRLLNYYLITRFITTFLLMFAGVYAIIILFDMIELNRELDRTGISTFKIMLISMMRTPNLLMKALPFIVLLSVMLSFARLSRSSEITVMRASGMSTRSILFPVLVTSCVLGVFSFSIFNPVAAWMLERAEHQQLAVAGDDAGLTGASSVARDGLWLRQGTQDYKTIIHAEYASQDATGLENVTFYVYDNITDTLVTRLDAQSAVLEADFNVWRLKDVRKTTFSTDLNAPTQLEKFVEVPTTLTETQIEDSFSSPDTVAFWGLPAFIENLRRSGLSVQHHVLHWYSLMSLPLTYMSMVVLAAAFSMRPARFGGLGAMALGGIISGFGYYFIQDVALALGASGGLTPLVAVWVPPLSSLLLGTGLLLHMEDT